MDTFILVVTAVMLVFVGFAFGNIFQIRKHIKVLKLIGEKLDDDGVNSEKDMGFYEGAMWVFDKLK